MYAELDKDEKKRYDSLRDLEAIHDAMAQAQLDAESVGFAQSYRATDASRSTNEADAALFAASQHPSPAPDWLAEATEALAGVARVGRLARFFWPPPFAPGTVVTQDGQSITVGGRSSTATNCAWCGDPADSGRDPVTGKTVIRRIGDHTVHAKNCYQQAYRDAGTRKTTILAVLAGRAAEKKTH